MAAPAPAEIAYPHHPPSEVTVLASLLWDSKLLETVADRLPEDAFFGDFRRRVYREMLSLYREGKEFDLHILRERLERDKVPDVLINLQELIDGSVRHSNLDSYVAALLTYHTRRRVMKTSNQFLMRAAETGESGEDLARAMESAVLSLAEVGQQQQWRPIAKVAEERLERALRLGRDPNAFLGLETGYADLDRLLVGLQAGALYILAARATVGKSAFCLNLVEGVCRRTPDAVVALFSLEMSEGSLADRLMCSIARVDTQRFRRGLINKEERADLFEAIGLMERWSLHLDDQAGTSLTQIQSRCRRLKREKGRLDAVFIDYLQLVRGLEGRTVNTRQQELATVSRGLKEMAKDLDCAVVALAQVNRNVDNRTDKRPHLSDLRESGDIEQDADVVMFLYREEMYEPEDPSVAGQAELLISKHREGPTGVVPLVFLHKYTRFESASREADPQPQQWTSDSFQEEGLCE